MKTFETKYDSNPIMIVVKPSSDALLDGPDKVRITIYNKNEPNKWRKVIVKETEPYEFKAEIKKERLKLRPIIKIKTNFFVDDINLKTPIAKATTVKYKLDDKVNSKHYKSAYNTNPDEYDLGRPDDQTFSVTKKVEVSFT